MDIKTAIDVHGEWGPISTYKVKKNKKYWRIQNESNAEYAHKNGKESFWLS